MNQWGCVSKNTWMKKSPAFRPHHFFFLEKIKLEIIEKLSLGS